MREAVLCILISADSSSSAAFSRRCSSSICCPRAITVPNCDAATLRVQSKWLELPHAAVPHELVLRVRLARPAANGPLTPTSAIASSRAHSASR